MKRKLWTFTAVVIAIGCKLLAEDGYNWPAEVGMERLCYLMPETMAFSESSYDRRGLNVDLPAPGLGNPHATYLGKDELGDKIFLDVKGAGCVYRLFMSEMEERKNARLKIYFDGSATPAINEKVCDLAQARVAGFSCPLVHIRNQVGTGAPFTSQNIDVPLPFAKAIKITCTDPGPNLYQNIQYHLFPPGTLIETWSPEQDLTKSLEIVNRLGIDPKSTVGNGIVTGKKDLGAGVAVTLLEVTGKRQIQSIRIKLPGFTATAGETLTAIGNAFTNTSQFQAEVNPSNDGVRLQRVYAAKPGMSSQATVFVDGQEVGIWKTAVPEPDMSSQAAVFDDVREVGNWKTAVPDASGAPDQLWRESIFYIPRVFTKGKKTLLIKVVNGQPGKAWNEYAYSVFSNFTDADFTNPEREASDKKTKALGYRLTDRMMVGEATSAAAHAYACSGVTWRGETSSKYLARCADYVSMLTDIRIRMSWDDESVPSVDARLCEFFGQTEFGLENTERSAIGRSVPVGLDEDNQLYCYFPMPFRTKGVIELVSTRAQTTPAIGYEIQYKDFSDDFSRVGYFKTASVHEKKTATDTSCFTLVDVKGAGKLVGVSANMIGGPIVTAAYLEGDERVYVDGGKTAAICGSGKEDFFGGSYYFYGGPASLPFSGCTYNAKWGYNSVFGGNDLPFKCSAYRFMINDCVPFRSQLKVYIEHGSHMNYPGWPGEEKDAPNHDLEESTYLTFYYLNPMPAMTLTDTLETANAESQVAHHYDPKDKTPVTKTGNWDRNGYYDQTNHTASGIAVLAQSVSAFTVRINPKNSGVMLRRLMWYADANQEAEVWVDGQNTGTWYDAGKNEQKETDKRPMLWRETPYFIPQQYTRGKDTLEVKIKVFSPVWNEYKYEVFSMTGN